LLTSFATVDEVRDALTKVRVVPVVEPALGFAPPVHFIVTEPSGKAIVIEYLKGEMKIFDAPLGVITNAPTYEWHETNLRNYINLSPVALPGKKIEDLNFRPLGGGSGMIGLPGDFTPPSRFVRAVAFSKTARPTATGDETIRAEPCPLLGVKRIWPGQSRMSACDPSRAAAHYPVPERTLSLFQVRTSLARIKKRVDQRGEERWICHIVLGPSSLAPSG
jgi:hypothetical protein